jgi:hypothetical protein
VSGLKNKFNRKPNQAPPKKKGNAEVISQLVNNDTVNTSIQETVSTSSQETTDTEKKVKKATFELDAGLHKRLRMFAVENETTMVDVVEKAINEYMDRADK